MTAAAVDIGGHYGRSRERMCELLDGGSFDTGSIAVDACPGWTVHSVVAHLVGVIEDASAGRIQGIPGPSQTAEQIRRHLTTRWRHCCNGGG